MVVFPLAESSVGRGQGAERVRRMGAADKRPLLSQLAPWRRWNIAATVVVGRVVSSGTTLKRLQRPRRGASGSTRLVNVPRSTQAASGQAGLEAGRKAKTRQTTESGGPSKTQLAASSYFGGCSVRACQCPD